MLVKLPKDGKGADAPLGGWGKAGAGWEPNGNAALLPSVFWPKTNCEVGKAGLAGSTAVAAAGREGVTIAGAADAVVAVARKPGSCPAVVVWLPA